MLAEKRPSFSLPTLGCECASSCVDYYYKNGRVVAAAAKIPPPHAQSIEESRLIREKQPKMDSRKLIELLRATIETDQNQRKQAEEQLTQVYIDDKNKNVIWGNSRA